MSAPTTKQSLRQQLRARRRALSPRQQQVAALALRKKLSRHLWFRQARHIAFYLPNDGEIDPTPLLELARLLGKQCYLPVILTSGKMQFRALAAGTQLRLNRYGIAEPSLGSRYRPTWMINLILLPLVGFDRQGNRLGMGGGYYDRALAKTNRPTVCQRRIGLAHNCQEVPRLDCERWDVPLQAIATESGIRLTGNKPKPHLYFPHVSS